MIVIYSWGIKLYVFKIIKLLWDIINFFFSI